MVPVTELYSEMVTQIINGISVERKFSIIGNPTLGYVRNVMIGVRNEAGDEFMSPSFQDGFSIGFGAFDQKLDDHAKRKYHPVDFSTNLQLSKFSELIQKYRFYQYSETVRVNLMP
jgi:hypothetical protein